MKRRHQRQRVALRQSIGCGKTKDMPDIVEREVNDIDNEAVNNVGRFYRRLQERDHTPQNQEETPLHPPVEISE